MSLIHNAAEWFKARETPVKRWYKDGNGRYAFGVMLEDQPIIVTAKKYLNDGDASFMAEKIVQRAIDLDALILLFVNGDRLLFDPETVDRAGTHAVADQERKQRGEDWIDVPAHHAVSLRKWIDHGERPPTPADIGIGRDPSTGQTDLTDHANTDT